MTLTPLHIFLVISAVWRLSSLFANEDGPFSVFAGIRNIAEQLCKKNKLCAALKLYDGLTCEWCNSILLAGPIVAAWWYFGDSIVLIVTPLAVSTWTIVIKYLIQTLEQIREYAEKVNRQADEPALLQYSEKHRAYYYTK